MTTGLRTNLQCILTELPDGTGVVLHLGTKHYFTLNAAGVFVWKQLSQTEARPESHIVRRLLEAFDVDADRAAADVTSVVAELVADDLLVAA